MPTCRPSFGIAVVALVLAFAVTSPETLGQTWPVGLAPWITHTSLTIPVGGAWGGVAFDPTGATLYMGGASNNPLATIEALPALRDPLTGRITGFGPPTTVTSAPDIDGGLASRNGTLFYTNYPTGTLGEFNGTTLNTYPLPAAATTGGGLVFIPAGFPNAGTLLVAAYSASAIYEVPLLALGNGFFAPTGVANLYATIPFGSEGLAFIPSGPLAGDLVVLNWSAGTLSILDIDPISGLPVGGASNPTLTVIVTGFSGPEGFDFDPVTGDGFLSEWSSPDQLHQIRGFDSFAPLAADAVAVSVGGGASMPFHLRAGSSNGARTYVVGVSASGSVPGTPIGAVVLPLNIDALTMFELQFLNTPLFSNFLGILDASGAATATLNLPPFALGSPLVVNFAYLLDAPIDFVSNPVVLTLLP